MMDIMHLPELGGGPASYIPAHTSSAAAASFRT